MNTAFRNLAAVLMLVLVNASLANTGSVNQLSGTLSVRKPDGSVRILASKSEIRSGDTLSTERGSYAQIKFSDGGQITMKPNTAIRIESFKFEEQKPQEDSLLFSLVKGGMRAVSGLIGKRGDPDAYQLGTATATVGIRGTTYSADDCVTIRDGDCARVVPAVYVSVSDGEIIVKNSSGQQVYTAGQFGLIAPNQRPLFLSTDPGLQFTPPATFIQSVQSGTAVNIGKSLECVVRR